MYSFKTARQTFNSKRIHNRPMIYVQITHSHWHERVKFYISYYCNNMQLTNQIQYHSNARRVTSEVVRDSIHV